MIYEKFKNALGSWAESLQPFIESKDCDEIYSTLKAQKDRGWISCPESINTYRAFKETPMDDVKVVFLLMDPYPWFKDGKFVADGIAMSCANTEILQPSLEKFYGGIEDDLYKGLNLQMLKSPDLKYLCNQGVMMLNTALTTRLNNTGYHTKLWAPFTKYLLEDVFSKIRHRVVFVLCGEKSQDFEGCINPLQHRIFKLEHPAHASYQKRPWIHDNIFTKCNKLLAEDEKTVIWDYEEAPF